PQSQTSDTGPNHHPGDLARTRQRHPRAQLSRARTMDSPRPATRQKRVAGIRRDSAGVGPPSALALAQYESPGPPRARSGRKSKLPQISDTRMRDRLRDRQKAPRWAIWPVWPGSVEVGWGHAPWREIAGNTRFH